jgi:hypothetical protein
LPTEVTGLSSTSNMTDLHRDREWDDLTCEQREQWIARYLATRGGGGYERPLSDTEIEERAREMYEVSKSDR